MWYRCVQCRFVFELSDYLPGAAGVYIVVSYLNEAIYLPDAAGLYIAASFLNEAITYRTQPVFTSLWVEFAKTLRVPGVAQLVSV